MVETRRTDGMVPELGRRDSGGLGRTSRSERSAGGGHRDRIPTLRQLASLVVNGILRLPQNYRRGMFLDILT